MTGEIAPLAEIAALCDRFGARLVVDEAHGLGVLGAAGRGAAEQAGVLDRVDAVTVAFSKSLASVGGAVMTSRAAADGIRASALPYVFSAGQRPRLGRCRAGRPPDPAQRAGADGEHPGERGAAAPGAGRGGHAADARPGRGHRRPDRRRRRSPRPPGGAPSTPGSTATPSPTRRCPRGRGRAPAVGHGHPHRRAAAPGRRGGRRPPCSRPGRWSTTIPRPLGRRRLTGGACDPRLAWTAMAEQQTRAGAPGAGAHGRGRRLRAGLSAARLRRPAGLRPAAHRRRRRDRALAGARRRSAASRSSPPSGGAPRGESSARGCCSACCRRRSTSSGWSGPDSRPEPVGQDDRRDRNPGAAPPRRERVEQGQPVHRLGGRPAVGEGPGRGRPRRSAARRARPAARRAAHLACSSARSPPPSWRWPRPTGSGSRSGAPGGSTSGTTARSRARTRPRPSPSTARSSS